MHSSNSLAEEATNTAAATGDGECLAAGKSLVLKGTAITQEWPKCFRFERKTVEDTFVFVLVASDLEGEDALVGVVVETSDGVPIIDTWVKPDAPYAKVLIEGTSEEIDVWITPKNTEVGDIYTGYMESHDDAQQDVISLSLGGRE